MKKYIYIYIGGKYYRLEIDDELDRHLRLSLKDDYQFKDNILILNTDDATKTYNLKRKVIRTILKQTREYDIPIEIKEQLDSFEKSLDFNKSHIYSSDLTQLEEMLNKVTNIYATLRASGLKKEEALKREQETAELKETLEQKFTTINEETNINIDDIRQILNEASQDPVLREYINPQRVDRALNNIIICQNEQEYIAKANQDIASFKLDDLSNIKGDTKIILPPNVSLKEAIFKLIESNYFKDKTATSNSGILDYHLSESNLNNYRSELVEAFYNMAKNKNRNKDNLMEEYFHGQKNELYYFINDIVKQNHETKSFQHLLEKTLVEEAVRKNYISRRFLDNIPNDTNASSSSSINFTNTSTSTKQATSIDQNINTQANQVQNLSANQEISSQANINNQTKFNHEEIEPRVNLSNFNLDKDNLESNKQELNEPTNNFYDLNLNSKQAGSSFIEFENNREINTTNNLNNSNKTNNVNNNNNNNNNNVNGDNNSNNPNNTNRTENKQAKDSDEGTTTSSISQNRQIQRRNISINNASVGVQTNRFRKNNMLLNQNNESDSSIYAEEEENNPDLGIDSGDDIASDGTINSSINEPNQDVVSNNDLVNSNNSLTNEAKKAGAKMAKDALMAFIKAHAGLIFIFGGLALILILIFLVILGSNTDTTSKSLGYGLGGYDYLELDNFCSDVYVYNTSSGDDGTYPFEEYVAGVVAAEVSSFNNSVAFETFAIAARTYALNRMNGNCRIEGNSRAQAFKKTDNQMIIEAVNNTRGLVLTKNNKIFGTQYDAFCWDHKDDDYYYVCQPYDVRGEYLKVPVDWANQYVRSLSGPAFLENARHASHGHGISQDGAYYLITEKNYTRDQVLTYFYGDDVKIMSIYQSTIGGEFPIDPNAPLYQNFTYLKGKSFEEMLGEQGMSVEEYNAYLASVVEKSGAGTREAAANLAVSFIGSLAQMGYRLNYDWGGKYYNEGVNPSWGTSKDNYFNSCTSIGGTLDIAYCRANYRWNSFDCSGFVNWVLRNSFGTEAYNSLNVYRFTTNIYGVKKDLDKNKAVCKVGDLLASDGHVVMVVGFDEANKRYIVAESRGNAINGGVSLGSYSYGAKGYWALDLSSVYND